MHRCLPRARSPYWFAAGAGFSVLTAILYVIFFSVIIGQDPSSLNIGGILLVFFIVSELIALGGYFNLRLFFYLSLSGFVVGLGLFLSMLRKPLGGFEDLAGAISFMMLTAAGLVAGIIAELAKFGWQRYKNR
jgi:hypothetical protein